MNTIEHTRKRFKRRIEYEREILVVLNSIQNSQSLHGLTQPAISSWINSNDFIQKVQLNQKVNDLSKALMIFCDASKSAFDLDKRINETEMKEKIKNLKEFVEQSYAVL